MRYGEINFDPFPDEETKGASQWTLTEGIPFLVTLREDDERKLQVRCYVDPEELTYAFVQILRDQDNYLLASPYHHSLSMTEDYPAILFHWLSRTELSVTLLPPRYTCEMSADSPTISKILQIVDQGRKTPGGTYDDFKKGVRYRDTWSYHPPGKRMVKFVIVPEELETALKARSLLASMRTMWEHIMERWGAVVLREDELKVHNDKWKNVLLGISRTIESMESQEND